MAGKKNIFGLVCLGSLAVVLAGMSLTGCAKRVMRTEAPVEVAQTPPAETTPDKPPTQPPSGSRLG
ncbi:MAG: hypothetical protein KAH56_02365, partial [Candidatus Krumholzibacteria bacterium]|nr:hypothetical protein [Candidatus Krumholzibacteria bacterium]